MTDPQPACTHAACARRALSRRRALTGATLAGVGVPLLAACSGSSSSPAAVDPTTGTATTSGAPATSPPAPESSSAGAEGIAGTSDIEVGGGAIFGDENVVITQPVEGEFKAFSATCTHTGCAVGEVTDGEIVCPCHGSRFSIEDGSVIDGPASGPLAEMSVAVDGDQLVLG